MKSILLVEDSKFLRHANQRALMKAGYTVLAACDGQEALRMAGKETIDLILLDMMLPKLSGPEVLSALRVNPHTAKVPIIVLSGLSQKNEIRLLRDGANAYFEKSKLDSDEGWQSLLDLVEGTISTSAEVQPAQD